MEIHSRSLNMGVFDRFPELETKRLHLRDIRLEDAEAIFGMRSNSRVNRFIPRPGMEQNEQAIDLVERTRAAFANKQAIGWAARIKGGGDIIGTCGFNQIEHGNLRAEIGGEMSVEYWGQRYALEAVQEIVRFGMEDLGLHTIEAKVSPENRGAIFILESLGFTKEAHYRDRAYFNGKWLDMAVYGLVGQ